MSPTAAPLVMDDLDRAVDAVLDRVSGDIVLGIPLGIGKPNPFVNALYRRLKAQDTRRLRIVTALSLEKPVGKSELERHFLAPLVERVFADYPDLDYVKDSRAGTLPAHIEVREFFLKTGDYLGNAAAQQGYISTNYTFVARDMALQGMNVIAQAVASDGEGAHWQLSLSSNPDLTFEIAERYAAQGLPLLKVGVVNQRMPFMPNHAEVGPDFFDIVVTDPRGTHELFAPPNGKVSTADYAIGLHASSLVRDGGTLQIGIGSLGDAIAQALILRERQGADYRRILTTLCPDGLDGRETGRFEQGLYGCSEMFVNGFLQLMEAGIVRREVFDDAVLQELINAGRIPDLAVTPDTLRALQAAGRIDSPLRQRDLEFLGRFGILKAGLRREGHELVDGDTRLRNDLDDADAFEAICSAWLGTRLAHGVFMTGGFFLGPGDFYERLRHLPRSRLAKIDMTRIDFINQLYGQHRGEMELKRAQRRQASFINTTMMVTLLGAAVSDGLESGQVVSGVGGQYNFVAMAHALPDARSILMLRATHEHRDGLKSSIVWSYGHATIPRHLRDIVITEYGVADLRGQSDGDVVKRLICIADSRFQDELIRAAQSHGKLEAGWQVPEAHRHNLPATLDSRLHPWSEAGALPDFPFGTDLTADELHIVRALKRLKKATEHPVDLVRLALKALWENREAPPAYLQRLGLDEATDFKQLFIRKLFAGNL
ncbi:acetyl-CoA hydrolase/transferase C-terminal domain-containing protein [Ideonella alba]|uniref:Acetyl-CoA hydrolase n=1 Tax=Ideonella alba TaxID=2824118 RepID=A0A941BKZ5_9BURK|nr:acetyl-CoA hydrolase/transferase C-terminal domain-containing protein [Ideonella alba]MBQ0930649.1 acetyl-CoA hydrolase [Ideonella alba]